jgi:hypothetical protein
MKANYRLFVGLAVFYAITTFVYYYVGGEPLGISCLLLELTACRDGWLLRLVY